MEINPHTSVDLIKSVIISLFIYYSIIHIVDVQKFIIDHFIV